MSVFVNISETMKHLSKLSKIIQVWILNRFFVLSGLEILVQVRQIKTPYIQEFTLLNKYIF